MPAEKAPRLRIAYLLNQFPSVSETFILEEMDQLVERGVEIIPCALVPPEPDEPIHPKAEAFVPEIIYRARPGSLASLGGWLKACIGSPKGGSSATLVAVAHSIRAPANARELLSSLSTACGFARALRDRRVDHIHAQFGSMPATVGMLLAEITGLTFSLSLHARDIYTNESILLSTKLMEAEFATVCTQVALDRLLATQPATVHGRLNLVRHGIDLNSFAGVKHRPTREPVIAIIGRLVEKKGHQVLFRAAEMLRRSRGQFTIAVAGDGPLLPELQAVADSLGVGHLVTFCGSLSREEIKDLLRVARCLVVPSIVAADGDRDGLPNVILEAAAVGTPVIGSHVTGIPEFIEHGETGLIVQPDNPRELSATIKAILDDPVGAAEMGQRARTKVIREYDSTRNVLALEAFFRETITRDARGDAPPDATNREGMTTSE